MIELTITTKLADPGEGNGFSVSFRVKPGDTGPVSKDELDLLKDALSAEGYAAVEELLRGQGRL